ncbi:MAG: HAMP domain-containing sensor histidine kinase [Candidatus Saccharibacteria bacterium]|nr:HAMP domain-containing sensor histidine kinase [Candidatus Saccharibacteria bacterium]
MESEVNGILVAAHELKAPLNLLRQLAFSLDEDPDNTKNIQSKMIQVTDRAIRQVNDLTKIAHLDREIFEIEPIAVRSVCTDVSDELRQLFRFNHRSLNLDYANRSRLVVANRDLLYSIVYNFCLNAMHYSEHDSFATLSLHDRRSFVRLSVRDFGPTLPSDIWQCLKTGWIKKPVSISMRPGSSGLGLYIASKFSQYMNLNLGAIRHRDGTTFFVDLPVSRQKVLFI